MTDSRPFSSDDYGIELKYHGGAWLSCRICGGPNGWFTDDDETSIDEMSFTELLAVCAGHHAEKHTAPDPHAGHEPYCYVRSGGRCMCGEDTTPVRIT